MELTFNTVQLQKMNLSEGDILSVKLIGNELDESNLSSLKESLASVFPNNRIMVFTMPEKTDILFEVIQTKAPAPVANYCSDCSCGKKERYEG